MNWRFWKKICANNSMEDDKQVSLTPALLNRDSESDKKQYRSVLNLARKLEEKDILNIALTGPYGSGKSSILRSLMKDYRKYKYLSISLATLKSPLDDKKNKIDIDTMNNRIEYSILQQLIYKEKQETLYNSRLKRIYHKSTWAQYALSFAGKSRDQKAKQNVSAPGRHFIGLGRGWTFSGIGIQYDLVS